MAIPKTKSELLKSQHAELVKSYTTYDGSNRPQYIYVAQVDCPNLGDCIRTEYTYLLTTSLVVKRKESYQTWDSTWDV